MVEIATSLGRSGLQDWLLQRVSALVLGLYTLFMLAYLFLNPKLSYQEWQLLFSSNGMRYASLFVLLSLIAHSWIGIWTVTTDYIKPASIRLWVQLLIIFALIGCFVWGIQILWRF